MISNMWHLAGSVWLWEMGLYVTMVIAVLRLAACKFSKWSQQFDMM